jgi:tetratricopeptide (TPR) repeat protein
VRAAVEAAHGEGIELAHAGKPEQALAAARRALDLARTGQADDALMGRAQRFVAQAELDLGAAERERALRAQDEILLRRLIDLRLVQLEAIASLRREVEIDADFARAFRDYGVDLEADDLLPALERIRDRGMNAEVALALDDWGRLRRKVHGFHSEKAENLLILAMDLDPDPERLRLRQAILDNDKETLLQLAAPEELVKLPPGSIWILSTTLWDNFPEEQPTVYRMYDQALHLHPQDFVLQSIGGRIYQRAGRMEAALACRLVALGLQPDRADTRLSVAESLFFNGRLTDADGAYRAAIEADPSDPQGHYGLGMTLLQLGDREGALACLLRVKELKMDLAQEADLQSVRYFLGLERRATLIAAIEREPPSQRVATFLYALLEHDDPEQRDVTLVVNALAARADYYSTTDWGWVLEAVARVRAGDWQGAAAALSGRYEDPTLLLLTPNALDFLRATVHARTGNAEAARESFLRGMKQWRRKTGGNPEAWERSDVMRWRREAEAAMAG